MRTSEVPPRRKAHVPDMPLPTFPRFVTDVDDPTSVDDLYWRDVDIHLERMADGHYWLGVTTRDNQTMHIDFVIERPTRDRPLRKTRIRARPRK